MDPLQWMGAVRMRCDKNITKIQKYSKTHPSINVLWSEKLHVYKKQEEVCVHYLWIIVMFLSAVWTWASDIMLNFYNSALMKKQLI